MWLFYLNYNEAQSTREKTRAVINLPDLKKRALMSLHSSSQLIKLLWMLFFFINLSIFPSLYWMLFDLRATFVWDVCGRACVCDVIGRILDVLHMLPSLELHVNSPSDVTFSEERVQTCFSNGCSRARSIIEPSNRWCEKWCNIRFLGDDYHFNLAMIIVDWIYIVLHIGPIIHSHWWWW